MLIKTIKSLKPITPQTPFPCLVVSMAASVYVAQDLVYRLDGISEEEEIERAGSIRVRLRDDVTTYSLPISQLRYLCPIGEQ